jgi:hypothetical protein
MSTHYLIKDRVVIQFTTVPPEAPAIVNVRVGFNPPVATTIEAARNLWASTIDNGATVATMEQVHECWAAGYKRNQK